MNNARGTLFVLTGPSGAGKGTILNEVLKERDDLFVSVSATTRAPRTGEKHGVSYYFLTKDEFLKKIENGAFLEHAQYVDNFYGTLEAPVEEKLAEGFDVLLEIEVQGAKKVHEKRADAVMVFVAPPSFDELTNRLKGRGTETDDKIEKRLNTAKTELQFAKEFDYIIINDDLKKAKNELCSILTAERCRASKRLSLI